MQILMNVWKMLEFVRKEHVLIQMEGWYASALKVTYSAQMVWNVLTSERSCVTMNSIEVSIVLLLIAFFHSEIGIMFSYTSGF